MAKAMANFFCHWSKRGKKQWQKAMAKNIYINIENFFAIGQHPAPDTRQEPTVKKREKGARFYAGSATT